MRDPFVADSAAPPVLELSAAEALESVGDALIVLDHDWRFRFLNSAAERLLEASADELLGAVVWERFPGAVGTEFERQYRDALRDGRRRAFTEYYGDELDRWFGVQVVPHRRGLSVVFHDVTEIKGAETRTARIAETQRVLRDVATAVAQEQTVEEILALACDRARALLGAHSCWALELDGATVRVTGASTSAQLPGGAELPGVGAVLEAAPGGQVAAVAAEGRSTTGPPRGLLGTWGLGTGAAVPIRVGGRVWGALTIGWREADVATEETLTLLEHLADLVGVCVSNAEARETIARQAATDELTGLANLRTCQQRLDEGIARARRHGHPLTLALVDVDHFKGVNDGHGHVVGDRALEAVAAQLRAARRPHDLAARIGGDEFALVLDGADAAASLRVAERLRAQIAALDVPGVPPITVSVGLCGWSPGLTREELQRRADDALYWAKLHGRDAAWAYDPDVMGADASEARAARDLRRAGAVADPVDLYERLRSTRAFWQSTLDALSQHVSVLDEHGTIIATNAAWRRFAEENGGDPETTGVGMDYLAVCAVAGDPTADVVAAGLRALLAGERDTFELDYPCPAPDEVRWFAIRATRVAGDGPRRVVVHHEDITERRLARDRIALQAQLLHRIPGAVVATDRAGRITQWSDGAERLYGYTREEALGQPVEQLLVARDAEARQEAKAGATSREGTMELREKSGRWRPVAVQAATLTDASGAEIGSIAVSVDATERLAQQRRLEEARDYLLAVTESMGSGLLTCGPDGRVTYANETAAQLLRRPVEDLVGLPLRDAVYGAGTPAPGAPDIVGGAATARNDDVFVRGDQTTFPAVWTSSQLVADPQGEGRVIVFGDDSARRTRETQLEREAEGLRWAARIRSALDEGAFVAFAQPIVRAADGGVAGHELLIRLRDGAGGYVPPGEFLPAAEDHGLIGAIDAWMVGLATELAAAGRAVHVNLSAQSVGPAILDQLRSALEGAPAVAARITVELTETAFMDDAQAGRDFAVGIRGLGCRLALDDFGTGYNSFARLKDAPVDELKIDLQFVRDVLTDAASESVVTAIVSLAGALGLRTVAEGVEDEATAARLRELGADHLQGFHFGRPAPVEAPGAAADGADTAADEDVGTLLRVAWQRDAGHVTLALSGELEIDTTALLRQAVAAVQPGQPYTLDLADVTFIDSTGLALLVALVREDGAAGRLVLRRPSKAVRSVVSVVGLADALPFSAV